MLSIEVSVQADTRTEHKCICSRLNHPDASERSVDASHDGLPALTQSAAEFLRRDQRSPDFGVHAIETAADSDRHCLLFQLVRLFLSLREQLLRFDVAR